MRPTTLLGALLIAGALTTIPTAATAVDDCTSSLSNNSEIDLADSTALWDINSDGSIGDGELLAGGRTDAYDTFPVFAIDDGTNGREDYTNAADTCTYEADGRQVAFPTMTTLGGLELSRKVYVPATGASFARFYNQVHNPGAGPKTITLYTSNGATGDLGSDSSTIVDDSSAGTGVAFVAGQLNSPVSWLTTSDDATAPEDPVLAHNLDAGFNRVVHDRVDAVLQDPSADQLSFVYQNVTVPAGGTVAYLSFEALRSTIADAGVIARAIDAHPASLFTGLLPAELAAIQNWVGTDIDVDGVANATDNCPSVANTTQADLDKDGQGDACDADIDGDGIANEVETAIGTNPLSADTDGDGVKDNADQCPKISAPTANGCPPSARRTSTTKLKVHESKTGPVVLKAKGTVKSTSTALPNDCTHGSAALIVKVGTKVVTTKIVRLKSTCVFKSKLTLEMPRKKVHDVKVTGWFLGSDGLLPSRDKVKLS